MTYKLSQIPRLVEEGVLPRATLDQLAMRYDEIEEILAENHTASIRADNLTIIIGRD